MLEVRIEARNVLISYFINLNYHSNESQIEELFLKFQNLAQTKLPKRPFSQTNSKKEEIINNNKNSTNMNKNDYSDFVKAMKLAVKRKHSGVLGISALILLCPYTVPSWMPNVISKFSKYATARVPICNTVRDTIAHFNQTHMDEWHIFKKQFTQTQIDDIKDVAATQSYFV